MDISAISIFKNYFNFISISGIFPYKLIYTENPNREIISHQNQDEGSKQVHHVSVIQSNLNIVSPATYSYNATNITDPEIINSTTKLVSIGFHKRGFNLIIHIFVMFIFYLYALFQVFQLFRRAFSGAGMIELFGMSCWLWKLLFVGIFFIHFHANKQEIADFHTNWHLIESDFYRRTVTHNN